MGENGGLSMKTLPQFFDRLTDAIAVCDSAGRICFVNSRAEQIFGYTRGELCGGLMESLLPEYRTCLQEAFLHEAETPAQLMALGKDEGTFMVEVTFSSASVDSEPYFVAVIRTDGQRTGVAPYPDREQLATYKADRHKGLKLSTQSARDSDLHLAELVAGLPVAVYTTDADGYLTLYNEAAEALWGRRPVIGKDRWCGSWKLYDADGSPLPLDLCPLAITLREKRPVRAAEVTLERPDGTRLTFIPHPTPLRDASGKIIGAMNVLVNITERKRAEQALQRQAGLLDLAFDAILVWRHPGGIEFWNKGATLLYGFEKEDALGKISHDLLRSRRSVPWSEIEKELRKRGFWEGEVRHTTKEGNEVLVSSRHQLVADAGGTMIILETNRDITESKRVEQALRQSRQQMAGILGSAMDAIISVDATRKVVLFNRAAETMFQCPASEAIGDTLDRFIPERFRGAHDGHIRRFGETGETTRKMGKLGTVYGLRADGKEFPIEASISQMESAGQKLYTVIVRDITRRVREEETLKRQAELLHLSHDAIFVWNAASGVEFWSHGAAQLYGYEPDEVHGRSPQALFRQNFPTPWKQIETELQDRGLWEGELHRQNKTGREVFVSCRLQRVSTAGAAAVILETDRDITERRRLEQELLEAGSAEQRRIGQDLHDGLCQHLAGIEFRTSALIDQLAESPDVQREIAKIGGLIREGARQARMLSRGLSPVSLEADGLMSALKELTENASKLFNKSCQFECPRPVSIQSNVVATHLYRIAQEAISNAARHGRANKIVVALSRTDKETTLRITDDGTGLPPTTARSDGMGLRIMKYRAEMIGASLTIGAAKNGGTSLVCTLRSL